MKKLIAVLLVAVLALTCFAACGKKDDDSKAAPASVEGVYTVKSINGQSVEAYFESQLGDEEAGTAGMTLDDILKFMGIESLDDFLSIELKADGTVVMNFSGESGEGTWTQDGDKITLTVDGEAEDVTLKDGELVLDLDGDEMILAKK